MYEEIEYFKRFAKCYLMWSHSNMDRIVRDAIRKDKEVEDKRLKEARAKAIMSSLPEYDGSASDFIFGKAILFGVKKL